MIQYISSIIFGLFIAYLITSRVKFHGPDSNVIKHEIYNNNGQCIKFEPVPYICPL